jgi:hypothetical protein
MIHLILFSIQEEIYVNRPCRKYKSSSLAKLIINWTSHERQRFRTKPRIRHGLDTVESDYLDVKTVIETIKITDLVEHQRTLAKRRLCRALDQELEADLNDIKHLLVSRNSIRSRILGAIGQDEARKRVGRWSGKRENLQETWIEMCRTRGSFANWDSLNFEVD